MSARPEVETGPNDYLDNLDLFLMVNGEARKDKWSIFADMVYLDFSCVHGRVKLGDGNWSMPYYADIGTGSSTLTWQTMAGVAYSWSWGDVGLVYRHLAYDMDDNQLLQDVEFSGPAPGAAFHF